MATSKSDEFQTTSDVSMSSIARLPAHLLVALRWIVLLALPGIGDAACRVGDRISATLQGGWRTATVLEEYPGDIIYLDLGI